MRKWLLCVLLLFLPGAIEAQTTSVSGTITDASATAWKNGTYTFFFNPAPNAPTGPYRQGGQPFNSSQFITGSLDSTGSLTSVPVPDNLTIFPSGSTWKAQFCPAATASNGCFTTTLTITGASQNITGSVSPPAVQVAVNAGQPPYAAYNDAEIVGAKQGSFYTNLTDATIHFCSTVPPCVWVSLGNGSVVQPAVTGDGVVIVNSSGRLGDSGQPPLGVTSVSATDSFNRANSNPIAAPWVATGAFPLPQLLNNAVSIAGLTTQTDIAVYSGITWPNDQFVQASVTQLVHNAGYLGEVVRSDGTGNNFYFFVLDASGISGGVGGIGIPTPLNLFKVSGGVTTTLIQFPAVTPQISDNFKFQVVGTTLSVFQNNTLAGTFTDSSSPLLTGSGGLFIETGSSVGAVANLTWDNWSGGGVGTGGITAGHLANFSSVPNQISDSGVTGVAGALGANTLNTSGQITTKRLNTGNGTALVAGDFSIGAGFGSTAALSFINCTDSGGEFVVTPNGAGITAGPSILLTFHDGAWSGGFPTVIAIRGDNNAPTTAYWVPASSPTNVSFAFIGLPVAGTTYTVIWFAAGIKP